LADFITIVVGFKFSGTHNDRGIPVPLGWLLSRRVADELRAQLDPPPAGADCKNSKQGAASNFCELKTFANMMTWAND
jgi:hypothetical protein